MKIGILTFHSQLNYGGVLQAYALQTLLEHMGHTVIVFDRWLTLNNQVLLGPFVSFFSFLKWVGRLLLGKATFGGGCRHIKTYRFIHKNLHLSPFHFYQWQEISEFDLGVDVIVVGSDQVWNATYNDLEVYLLAHAPIGVPAIAYACSFGMQSIPERLIEGYRQGFKRFEKIGVRELEGKKLVNACGQDATHVLDPTLLLERSDWEALVHPIKLKQPLLVYYLVSENIDIDENLILLERFAHTHKVDVAVLVGGDFQLSYRGMSFKNILSGQWRRMKRLFSSVKIVSSADPSDFVSYFSSASWIISDSFHALIFSLIFEKPIVSIIPTSEYRLKMFSRIREIARNLNIPETKIFAKSMGNALNLIKTNFDFGYNRQKLEREKNCSLQWLKDALAGVIAPPRQQLPRGHLPQV